VVDLYRAGTSVIEGRPVKLRLLLFECPFCGAPQSRKSTRTRLFEKPLAFLIWPRRCRSCGHRYYAPLLWCVRPNTFWAIFIVLAVGACAGWFLWFVSGLLSPPPIPTI
jgi:uncharacterized protein (DUF983 family)